MAIRKATFRGKLRLPQRSCGAAKGESSPQALDDIMVLMGIKTNSLHRPKATNNNVATWATLVLVGIIVYVIIDIVLTFLRPDYNWLHNAESDYGRGPFFWLMDGNFLVRCLFSLALVRTLFLRFPKDKLVRQAGFWISVWAVASGLLAFFADNPYGYAKIWSGEAHLLLAFIAFIAALIAMVAFRRLAPMIQLGNSTNLSLTVLTAIAFVSLILLGHAGFRPYSPGGLYERVFLAAVLTWEIILALFAK